uniref:Uncharacterized protein n=1 Tax=Anopheles stephensi TaxID=30069 RepID=A0A182YTE8_ANOST
MHTNLRTVPVPGDPARSGHAHRPGLRAGREWLRLQTEVRDRKATRNRWQLYPV